jgi:signal peptidase I
MVIKTFLNSLLEVGVIVAVALAIVIPVRAFIMEPYFVRGESMEPNFSNSDYLIIERFSYRFSEPKRGEVIVFRAPQYQTQKYIKRIIGLPGETIAFQDGTIEVVTEDGTTLILDESPYLPSSFSSDDMEVTLREDEYFVLGDNRIASFDSRAWGVLPEENILGRVVLKVWPPSAFAKISAPEY